MPETMRSITEVVQRESLVGIRDIMSASRRLSVTDPRHVAWWLCRQHLQRTYHQMGRFFRRDHSTIINGVQRIERMRATDERIKTLIDNCETTIGGQNGQCYP